MSDSGWTPARVMSPLLAAQLACFSSLEGMLQHFLDGADQWLGAFAVGIYVHDSVTGRPAIAQVRGLGSYYAQSYELYGRDHDPVVQTAVERLQVCDSDSLMPQAEWQRLPIVRDVFGPHDMARVLCAPFVHDGAVVGTLNLARHEDQPPFEEADRELAKTAAAVLGVSVSAINGRVSLERERSQLRAAFDRSRTAVVLTDMTAARRHFNAPAAELMAKYRVGARELEGMLQCEGPSSAHSWDVVDDEGRDTTITVTSQRVPESPDVVISVLRTDDPARRALDPAVRAALTQREAEIAMNALRGKSDAEIAELLCLSPHTVKHHVKSIHAKLGVHNRAQLLARLM